MRAIKPVFVAILALAVGSDALLAPYGLGIARAADTEASADDRIPGPLRPVAPVAPTIVSNAPERVRPTPPPRDPAPRRPLVTPQPPRATPPTWSGALVAARRGSEVKGKILAVTATHELKLSDFSIADRPALEIWLTAADPAAPAATLLETKHVSLGRLRKSRGDQTYRFPAELDLAIYRTVVVWSRHDRAADAVARLIPARVD